MCRSACAVIASTLTTICVFVPLIFLGSLGGGFMRFMTDIGTTIMVVMVSSLLVALTVVLVLTMSLSDVINNAATAVVMAPISVGIAGQLNVNADCFLMAVAIGASCAFLTPIGHQNNALIMGPGGYKFGDYWRMGLPLEMLIVAVAIPMLLWIWPLN